MRSRRREPVTAVPPSLRTWFIVHFAVDAAFAIPLFVSPERFLGLLGWGGVDPVASRMVAAALFGIGGESWRMRLGGREAFRTMLDLKIVWSAFAEFGLAWSLLQGGPPILWLLLAIFGGFSAVWIRYRRLLGADKRPRA